ncbi:mariner Mos1 transposase [Trichonephila clavipes]|nr:mariner Mos1 transposase [Trichonephila clavipes]
MARSGRISVVSYPFSNCPPAERPRPPCGAWAPRWETLVYSILVDQEGPIYYELLKPGETVNTDRYKQQLLNLNDSILEKGEQYKKRQHKVIFLDDNAPIATVLNPPRTSLKALVWDP